MKYFSTPLLPHADFSPMVLQERNQILNINYKTSINIFSTMRIIRIIYYYLHIIIGNIIEIRVKYDKY